MTTTQTITRWVFGICIIVAAYLLLLMPPLSTPIVISLLIALIAVVFFSIIFRGDRKEPMDHVFDPATTDNNAKHHYDETDISDPIFVNETWILRN